LAEYPIMHH